MESWKPWKRALILKVLGKNVSYKFLANKLNDLWTPICLVELTDLTMNFFLVRFRCKEDYDHVFHEGPWTITGNYLTTRKWSPDFKPSEDTINTTLVQVRFLGLSIEYFMEDTLLHCGNAIEREVKVDKQTADTYAKVCVEIDLNKPLVPFIGLGMSYNPWSMKGYIKSVLNAENMVTYKMSASEQKKP
ncbi:hypothetical protein ACH5RR_025001 [Cinchona calisaya]|uniref:DUF4283 domain-containing protein n=1 Tax=Cinchona calisaya TaxID=153742 RepID=A0ABD2YZF3_9GENT